MSTSHQNEGITNEIFYILFVRNKASNSDVYITFTAHLSTQPHFKCTTAQEASDRGTGQCESRAADQGLAQ